MPQTHTEAAKLKAAQVWLRLIDCFGDSVQRKFPGNEPPNEWVMAIGMLRNDQIDRAFRRMLYQGMASPPGLPAFMRLARAIGDETDPDGAPPPLPVLQGPQIDPWEVQGNLWLLSYIRTQLAANPRRYGRPASFSVLGVFPEQFDRWNKYRHDMGRAPVDPHRLDASTAFTANVGRLVQAKKLWAADMRDLGQNDTHGRVPMELAKATWADYIGFAEKGMEADPVKATEAPI